jgi:hypothetical protein
MGIPQGGRAWAHRVQAMVASVPQRRFGPPGMIMPSCGRGLRRPRTRWGAKSPSRAAAAGPVSRSPGRRARDPAERGSCGYPRQRTARRGAPCGSAAASPGHRSREPGQTVPTPSAGGGRIPWSGVRRGCGTPPPAAVGGPRLFWAASPAGSGPRLFGRGPQDLVLMVSCPILRSAWRRPDPQKSGPAADPSGLVCRRLGSHRARRPAGAPPPAAPGRVLRAIRRAVAAVPPPSSCPPTTWAGTDSHRSARVGSGCSPHDRYLHPCLLGAQENRQRWRGSRCRCTFTPETGRHPAGRVAALRRWRHERCTQRRSKSEATCPAQPAACFGVSPRLRGQRC